MAEKVIRQDHKNLPCVILIGMPAAGKSTIGEKLAQKLGWAFIDSDKLLEALYGTRLQNITDALGKEAFLDTECEIIRSIRANRCVISTGGSVVYRDAAINHLTQLGPICHIQLALDKIIERIQLNPERGIAIAPGQSIEDLFREREALYKKAAQLKCDTNSKNPDQCVAEIMKQLKTLGWGKFCNALK